jgi:peroxiredoxin
MQAYQLGIAKFDSADSVVFGISTDNVPSQKEFATKLGLTFPLLSDFVDRKVSKDYGVLIPERGFANRVTFVVDKDGKIAFVEAGADAMATVGAPDACSRLAHRQGATSK